MIFNTFQRAFIIESYFRNGFQVDGEWTYSIPPCFVEFRERYPNEIITYRKFYDLVKNLVSNFRETGSVGRKEGSGRPKKRVPALIETVRQRIDEAPKTPIRHLCQQVDDLSYGTCHRILRQDLHLHPYRFISVQELLEQDYPKRVQFCRWFLDNLNDEQLNLTFFTDEAWFYLNGYVNSQNMRIWSSENPHVTIEAPLHSQKIGVWVEMSRRRLVGPIFFEGTLTAARYRNELLQPFLNELHDDELRDGFLQQDGATAHAAADTINFLREYFDDRIISRNTATPWPPRSCDITVLDFFLWPYLKNTIFKTPVNDLNELKLRIEEHCQEINNSPQLLQNVFEGMRRRVQKCLEEEGRHFQHLL